MKFSMIFFGILFLVQGLLVLKNKQFGTGEGNLGLRGVVKGKLAVAFGGFFTLIGLFLIVMGFVT